MTDSLNTFDPIKIQRHHNNKRLDDAILKLLSDPQFRPIKGEWLRDDVNMADVAQSMLRYSRELIDRTTLPTEQLVEIKSILETVVFTENGAVTRGAGVQVGNALDLAIKRQAEDIDEGKAAFMLQYMLNARLSGRADDLGGPLKRDNIVEASSDLYDKTIKVAKKGNKS